ncbi:unnamed protein product [Nesidiocoris tenuis]|uniref:Uncharacterized protein n=1 Tax=Nesidiocoris tenuis TaxID=355587 RepID=A0A6H5H3R1_9HEMI|nr:unnamed protein product [Nesidiocoris tenuis]
MIYLCNIHLLQPTDDQSVAVSGGAFNWTRIYKKRTKYTLEKFEIKFTPLPCSAGGEWSVNETLYILKRLHWIYCHVHQCGNISTVNLQNLVY